MQLKDDLDATNSTAHVDEIVTRLGWPNESDLIGPTVNSSAVISWA
jgi:hypothetical protein